jgi:hypothetical protein
MGDDSQPAPTPAPAPDDRPAPPPGQPPARRNAAVLTVVLILGVALAVLFAGLRGEPVIEFEARTSVLSFTVTGASGATWNLPSKRVKQLEIVGDEPRDKIRELGIGPLFLPPGTQVRLTRHEGEAIEIVIDATDAKQAPFLLDASTPDRIPLRQHDRIGIGIPAAPADTGAEACRVALPHMTFRAVGAIKIGEEMAEDAYDDQDQLVRMDEEAFVAQFVQPTLLAGDVAVMGRSIVTGRPYHVEDLKLRRGDVLSFARPGALPQQPGTFFVETGGCEPLFVQGAQASRDAEIRHIGKDARPLSLSVWQIVAGDGVISLMVAGLAALLGALRVALDIAEFRRGFFPPPAAPPPSQPPRSRRRRQSQD